uniref:Uncharacterized protein n=1 Tax=Arundo donax TaxID=35708 RepID=A0A0A8Y6W2_ARUDO
MLPKTIFLQLNQFVTYSGKNQSDKYKKGNRLFRSRCKKLEVWD